MADKVLHGCHRPLLVITATADPREHPQAVEYRHIAVPLDGSALAEQALPVASQLAQAVGALVTLVRVEPWLPQLVGAAPFGVNVTVENERVHQDAETYLRTILQRLPATLQAHTVVLRGEPAAQLSQFCRRAQIAVAVMTSHGRGGIRRLALGSTTDQLIRAGVPVLLVPVVDD